MRFLRVAIVMGVSSALIVLIGLLLHLPKPAQARPLSSTWIVGGACGATIQACIDFA